MLTNEEEIVTKRVPVDDIEQWDGDEEKSDWIRIQLCDVYGDLPYRFRWEEISREKVGDEYVIKYKCSNIR